ncbi:MAG: T9SS type A sorting domain-containing protein [Weeksellaceae bacterium]
MRQFLFSLLWMSFGIASFAQVQNYNVGDTVDNFTVIDTKGVEHTLYDITASGKYIFIDFFFVTCPPCQATQKYFNELHEKYGCNQGEVYTLSISDVPENTNAAIEQYEATYGGPFIHGPAAGIEGNGIQAGNNIGIIAYPTYFLVGPDNKLINKDIWPVYNVQTYESAFPPGFNPAPMDCDEAMGTSELESQMFSLYPSVSDGNFSLSLTKNSNAEVSIFNMAGQQVYQNTFKSVKNIHLNLSLSPGVYVVKVQTDGKPASKKMIIR